MVGTLAKLYSIMISTKTELYCVALSTAEHYGVMVSTLAKLWYNDQHQD